MFIKIRWVVKERASSKLRWHKRNEDWMGLGLVTDVSSSLCSKNVINIVNISETIFEREIVSNIHYPIFKLPSEPTPHILSKWL